MRLATVRLFERTGSWHAHDAAGMRSLFRYHRRTTGIAPAHPHRFRHTFASDMVRAGISLPALMHSPKNGARVGPFSDIAISRPTSILLGFAV